MRSTLEAQGLNFEVHHPGRVDAFQLFKPHVLNWINATQAALTKRCQQLEGTGMAAPLQGSPMGMPRNHLVGTAAAPMLEVIDFGGHMLLFILCCVVTMCWWGRSVWWYGEKTSAFARFMCHRGKP